jgi:hypothetical protein
LEAITVAKRKRQKIQVDQRPKEIETSFREIEQLMRHDSYARENGVIKQIWHE